MAIEEGRRKVLVFTRDMVGTVTLPSFQLMVVPIDLRVPSSEKLIVLVSFVFSKNGLSLKFW